MQDDKKRWRRNTAEHGANLDGLRPVAEDDNDDDYDDDDVDADDDCDDILQYSSLALNFIF